MDIVKAIILGIVEGITEFLPISSTGHLIVAEDVLHFKDEAAIFTVVIQFGAIMAAVWYFRNDLQKIIKGIVKGDRLMQRFALNVLLGVIPAGLVGLVVEKTVGISDSLLLIGCMLVVGGVAFIVIERLHRHKDTQTDMQYVHITRKRALMVGLAQVASIVPGVSRSGATIMGGMLAGLGRKTATVFSFYLSLPLMFAASLYKLIDDRSAISGISGGSATLIAGSIAALITSMVVISWLLRYVAKNNFTVFGIYRIVAGVLLSAYALLSR